MKISIKKHIPNTLTCCNLVCGCLSIMAALKGNLEVAAIWIIAAAVFDFSDGFAARLLKVPSAIGKELDSLSDVVSFGVAPGMICYTWLTRCMMELPPFMINGFTEFLPFLALIVPALSAVRLAKFNLDERQTSEFIGLPTPANALFLGFLPAAAQNVIFLNNFWVLLALTLLFAILLVCPIQMISLKFHHFKWKGNEARYLLLIIATILLILFHFGAFPLIILTYILISLFIVTFHKIQMV